MLAAGVEPNRRDRHARAAAPRMVDVDPEAARLEMGIVRHLARRRDRRARHVRLVEQLQDLVLGAGDRPRTDDVVDLGHVLGPARRGRIFGLLQKLRPSQHAAQRMPVPLG
jgi:hypothetical protein